MRRQAIQVAVAVLVIGGFLFGWEAGAANGLLRPYQFPAPSRIANAFVELTTRGFPSNISIWSHTGITMTRIAQGYLAALALALPLGLILGTFGTLEKLTAPLVIFGRSVATLSLLPLVIVWFGAGELTKVILIGYGCFWVMLSNVIAGVKYVDPVLLRAGRSLGLNRLELYRDVVVPAALPRIFAGARMALGVGFMVIVGAEMIGTIEGLGALIMEARSFYRSDITIVGMLVIGVIGYLISTALRQLESVLVPWGATLERVQR